MICRKCRKTLPDDAVYCCYCGASIARKTSHRNRPNGTGTAYKRGNTWTAKVTLGYIPDPDLAHSKAVTRTKGGFKSKAEALGYCQTLAQTAYKGPRSVPKLAEYWAIYSSGELAQLSKSKQVAYAGAWKKLSDLHYRLVDSITVADIRKTVSAVAPTYYTARDCKTVLTKLFELAGADGHCSKDIPSYIVLPKLQEKERQTFTEEEQANLWKAYEEGDMGSAIPLLMIYTGMMPGEAMDLKVENIDLDNHKILGVGKKTEVRKKSPIYLPDDIIPLVTDLIAHAQPTGRIWPKDEEKWYTIYYNALEHAGCRRLEPYCCRHSTATRLAITEGIAPQTIQRMMRWSTTRMLDRYAHPDDDAVFRAANRLKK